MNIGMAKLIQTVLTSGDHWSSLELQIMNIGMTKLIQMMPTIRAHWSQFELQIENDLI